MVTNPHGDWTLSYTSVRCGSAATWNLNGKCSFRITLFRVNMIPGEIALKYSRPVKLLARMRLTACGPNNFKLFPSQGFKRNTTLRIFYLRMLRAKNHLRRFTIKNFCDIFSGIHKFKFYTLGPYEWLG